MLRPIGGGWALADVERIYNVLENGTPGFTWVQLLPDKVLEDMEYYYDPEPNDDDHAAPIYASIINEIERRSNVTTSN
jgi:hypothetical protein